VLYFNLAQAMTASKVNADLSNPANVMFASDAFDITWQEPERLTDCSQIKERTGQINFP